FSPRGSLNSWENGVRTGPRLPPCAPVLQRFLEPQFSAQLLIRLADGSKNEIKECQTLASWQPLIGNLRLCHNARNPSAGRRPLTPGRGGSRPSAATSAAGRSRTSTCKS